MSEKKDVWHTKLGISGARAMLAKPVREKNERARLSDRPPGAMVEPQASALGLEILCLGGRLLNDEVTRVQCSTNIK